MTCGAVASAYGASAGEWDRGPGVIYRRLAERLVSYGEPLGGQLALDAGTGSGAAARALTARGAVVVGCDIALPMLTAGRDARPPGVVGDVGRLPFRAGAFDVAVAAFVINHLRRPELACAELGRVCRAGGLVLVSSFPAGPDPEVKAAVEGVLARWGWQPPDWYRALKADARAAAGSERGIKTALRTAGLERVRTAQSRVCFGDLAPEAVLAWRLGMPAIAPFVAALGDSARCDLLAEAGAAIRRCPPLELRMLVGVGHAARSRG